MRALNERLKTNYSGSFGAACIEFGNQSSATIAVGYPPVLTEAKQDTTRDKLRSLALEITLTDYLFVVVS